MIKSMTGYGGAKAADEGNKFSVEIRSVNNRYLDTSVRMPRGFLFAEDAVKSAVSSHISRGKVDVFVNVSTAVGSDITITVNDSLAAAYKTAIDHIKKKLGVEANVTAYQIARLAEVLTLDKNELDKEQAQSRLMAVTGSALADFDAMRVREGEKLYDDISSRLDTIESFVSVVEQRSPQTVVEYRERLTRKMQEVLESTQIDESRILTEAALYADRIAVDEETVRLRSHISQMRDMLKSKTPVGRKLDFLVQELNRETNTIGSKCNDTEVTKVVLEMKSEIEKIREQVQNIE